MPNKATILPAAPNALGVSQPVVCVVGPTASGKTDVAQVLAQALDGEVVSADSMQVYRGMDIGTGKLRPEQRLVTHWGFDLKDPGEPFSASLFQEYARSCFADIDARGKRSVLAGGTGFYVRAAIDDYDFPKGEQLGNPVRDYWAAFEKEHGTDALWEELAKQDPASAAIIHPHNSRRVIRAFELLAEGKSYAQQKGNLQSIKQAVPAVFIGLAVDPDILRKRIDARVDRMLEEGLVQEVSGLLEQGFREGITAPQAIGYKEIVAYLDGAVSLDEATERIKIATHRYAKRQRSWFGKDSRIQWIDADAATALELATKAQQLIARMSQTQVS